MDRKQGFFSVFREELVRGLSPSRSRSKSPARSASPVEGRNKVGTTHADFSLVSRSGIMRPMGETLTPLFEGPDVEEVGESKRVGSVIGQWVRGQLTRHPASDNGRADLRLLLGVMGAPLAPLTIQTTGPWPHLSINNAPIENSSAQYILQQYTAASGGQKILSSVKSAYAMGKLKMVASEMESATKVAKHRNSGRCAESGGFVLWKMNPDMWYVELAVGGSKAHAGCNGKIMWHHTPWLGAHTAKGPVRPLRRGLQGLDPRSTGSIFGGAICIGEKSINGEDCFILKHGADPETLKWRSEGGGEIIRHVMFGYFSQKTGLLVKMEDSQLTSGGDGVYMETSMESFLDDYRVVDGIMIAHSGRTVVTIFRFGDSAMSHTKTRMEETWTIEEVAFNIPGLSIDCFIPPADLKTDCVTQIYQNHAP